MKKKYFIFFILLILLILIKGYLFSSKYTADNAKNEYVLFIESLKSKSDTKVAYNVKILNTNDKFILNILDNSYNNIQTNLTKYSNYKYGDVIKVKGKISIPENLNNPGEFNYKLYLYSNNIHGLINTYEVPKQISYNKNFIQNIYSKVYMFKEHVKNIIKSSMEETNANLAMSMIYGDTTDLDESIKEDFEEVGVSHLMSVSGTHITSFMFVINILFRINKKENKCKNKKNKRIKIKGLIQIISICIYIIFTGFSISVFRSGIMIIISIVCDMLNKTKDKYKALVLTLGVILFHTPYAIFNVGMQLSFLATLGIIMFGKSVANEFYKLTNKIKNEIIKKIIKYIIENTAITIAVQLMIIPIQIQSFNKLPFPVILPNLILGIISTPIRVIGTIGIMLSFIPALSGKIFSFLEILVTILLRTSKIFKSISFGISTVSMPVIFLVLYYIFILGIFVYFKIKNITSSVRVKEGKYNFKKLLKYLKIFEATLFILIISLVTFINVYSICFSQYVYFFNVEQGDMSYIKCGKESVIVDIGSMSNNLAFNTISNYFKASNLNKVDAIIVSHMHKDHINGLESFLQNYKVGRVIYSKPKTINKAYTDFKELLNKYDVNLVEVKRGDVINIGEIQIQVLLPDEEYIESLDEVNTNSLVCKITVKDKQMLYMGDASIETEEKLIKENMDISNIYILKVGHHGSKTATSNEFIQKIKPENAVISALKKYYGHPHEQTTDTLKENNVYIYLTEQQGAIKFNLK
ncbi:MAG: DNA internalization-related competence protein ComEC/Rec2 [Clostridia bacterium]|nr:DNA internalization-related competence protein ComEC/Rec2 [Clostridia bacterium]